MFDVPKRLIELRLSAGFQRPADLVKASGISHATISRIENENQLPSIDVLEKLCNAMGITLSGFFKPGLNMTPYELKLNNLFNKLSDDQKEKLIAFIESLIEKE